MGRENKLENNVHREFAHTGEATCSHLWQCFRVFQPCLVKSSLSSRSGIGGGASSLQRREAASRWMHPLLAKASGTPAAPTDFLGDGESLAQCNCRSAVRDAPTPQIRRDALRTANSSSSFSGACSSWKMQTGMAMQGFPTKDNSQVLDAQRASVEVFADHVIAGQHLFCRCVLKEVSKSKQGTVSAVPSWGRPGESRCPKEAPPWPRGSPRWPAPSRPPARPHGTCLHKRRPRQEEKRKRRATVACHRLRLSVGIHQAFLSQSPRIPHLGMSSTSTFTWKLPATCTPNSLHVPIPGFHRLKRQQVTALSRSFGRCFRNQVLRTCLTTGCNASAPLHRSLQQLSANPRSASAVLHAVVLQSPGCLEHSAAVDSRNARLLASSC